MPKFFEYDNPGIAAHVRDIAAKAKDAEDNPTVVKSDKTIYANNNLEKPFSPMSKNDVEHRHTLSQGGGKDNFVVAKHRAEQQRFVKEYENMKSDRDVSGNFPMSMAQTAKVAKVVQEQEQKKQKDIGYLKRIKAAISLSKKAKMERADAKMLKKSIEKAIKAGESD